MKHFLIHAATKIRRFFWSRGFLKFILWATTLILLLYAEEDWRGARAWAATKAEWEAKGETFDLNYFVPPRVPDDQNLAGIPVFKLERVKGFKGQPYFDDVALQKALGGRSYDNDFPPTNNWRRGELPDMEKIRQIVSKKYAVAFKNGSPLTDPLAQIDALYPFIADLRAAATQPYCRFQYDDTMQIPAARSFGLITSQILVSKILTVHALFELENHQPDLAAEDLRINFKLASGVGRDPSLVSALVAMGIINISSGAIYDGLAWHLWSDAQLIEIDHMLKPIDFLADYQFAMRSEVAEAGLNIDYIKHAPPPEAYGYIFGMGMSNTGMTPNLWTWIPSLWPNGWWDQNKRQMAALILTHLSIVDPKAQRVFPTQVNELEKQLQRFAKQKDAIAPWNILFLQMTSYVPSQLPKFAVSQARVDEARIACALERYRLAHGVYPDSLDVLTPAYIDELPHDIINGEPYHYQLRADGTFALYSVGWNQKDDGGKIVYWKDSQNYPPNTIDFNEGDWVWPTPQTPPATEPPGQ